eukprot:scaffold23573_cov18-Tisochrysis_lutea.AAC.1
MQAEDTFSTLRKRRHVGPNCRSLPHLLESSMPILCSMRTNLTRRAIENKNTHYNPGALGLSSARNPLVGLADPH